MTFSDSLEDIINKKTDEDNKRQEMVAFTISNLLGSKKNSQISQYANSGAPNLNLQTTFIDDLVPDFDSKDLLRYVTFLHYGAFQLLTLLDIEKTLDFTILQRRIYQKMQRGCLTKISSPMNRK